MNPDYAAALIAIGHPAPSDDSLLASHLRSTIDIFGRKGVRIEYAADAQWLASNYGGTVAALLGGYGQEPVIQTAAGFRVYDSFGYAGTTPTLAAALALHSRTA